MSAHPTSPDDDPSLHSDPQRGPVRRDDGPAGGPPFRAIAMVLLTAVVIAVAIGLVQLFGSDSDDDTQQTAGHQGTTAQSAPQHPTAPSGGQSAAPPSGAQDETGQPAAAPQEAPAESGGQATAEQGGSAQQPPVPVRILNNSNVTGLAGRTGDQLRGAGFDVRDVTNFPSTQGVLPQSQVYFGDAPGEQQTAQAVAQKLGIQAQPRPQGFEPTMPGVIVVVTQDLQR